MLRSLLADTNTTLAPPMPMHVAAAGASTAKGTGGSGAAVGAPPSKHFTDDERTQVRGWDTRHCSVR